MKNDSENSAVFKENHLDTVSFYGIEKKPLLLFLEKETNEFSAQQIQLIEWRPSLNYFRENYFNLLSYVVGFIKQKDAENRTVSFFGKRWVKNFFRNLDILQNCLLFFINRTDIPVIITGSGPNLEKSLPIIKELQENCLIIAASSSVMALLHNSISPDIIITTDGGQWALKHLYPLFRRGNNNKSTTAIAAAVNAALPSQCAALPCLVINDGSLWQNIILRELSIPSVSISPRGTVTASAIELALKLSGGNIYLAGMDLAISGIRTHVRPYSFDQLFYEKASRLSPFYNECFTRSRMMRQGGSMGIYSSWFKNELPSWKERIFTLNENHEIFTKKIPVMNNPAAENEITVKRDLSSRFPNNKNIFNSFHLTNNKNTGLACNILFNALDNHQYSELLKNELVPLLFPLQKETTINELKKVIENIVNKTINDNTVINNNINEAVHG